MTDINHDYIVDYFASMLGKIYANARKDLDSGDRVTEINKIISSMLDEIPPDDTIDYPIPAPLDAPRFNPKEIEVEFINGVPYCSPQIKSDFIYFLIPKSIDANLSDELRSFIIALIQKECEGDF